MLVITILLLSVISSSKLGVTLSSSSTTILLSSNISSTLVLVVTTVIVYPFAIVICTLLMSISVAITVTPNININIRLIPIIFMIEIDASSFLSIKIIFPPFDDILIIHVLYYFVKFSIFVLPFSVSLGNSWSYILYVACTKKIRKIFLFFILFFILFALFTMVWVQNFFDIKLILLVNYFPWTEKISGNIFWYFFFISYLFTADVSI